LFALNEVADRLAHSRQPLVPQRLFINGGNGDDKGPQTSGMLGMLVSLLVAEKSGFELPELAEPESVRKLVDRMSSDAVDNMNRGLADGADLAVRN
jgi:hypothetical protein